MTDKVMSCLEKTSYSSLRGADSLSPTDTASVDVVGQLKDMW
jgi:hypothetical protein